MTDSEYARKLDELDRLLNDPDVPMEPAKVWSLLAEIAQRDLSMCHAARKRRLTAARSWPCGNVGCGRAGRVP